MSKSTYLKKRLRIRVLYQKGLTILEIAKEVSMTLDAVQEVLEDIGLKAKYKHEKTEPHAFAEHCGKRVKI